MGVIIGYIYFKFKINHFVALLILFIGIISLSLSIDQSSHIINYDRFIIWGLPSALIVFGAVNTKPFYNKILDNICFSDYIDRITFQKQIWIFNEMSSLIKTFYNNHLYQKNYGEKNIEFNPTDVRFTKVLTKYSTEYNNSIFIQNLCKQLNMDIKDMFSLWIDLKNKYTTEEIVELFDNENYEINKLDINRIYRFLNVLL